MILGPQTPPVALKCNANIVLVNLLLCLKTKVQFVFELSLASAADKKFSAENQSAIFFLKYLGNRKKIYLLRSMIENVLLLVEYSHVSKQMCYISKQC